MTAGPERAAPPSPYRLAATVTAAVIGGPLALIVWFCLSGGRRTHYWRSPWVRAGLATMLAGALPLLLTILAASLHLLADPNPNPLGFGLLFVFSAVLGSALVVVGIVVNERRGS